MPPAVKHTVRTDDVTIPGIEGPFAGVVSAPAGPGRWPVVLVLGELFGLNEVQRAAAERVAAAGFVAVAPNLLHRLTPLASLPEDDAGRAQGLAFAARLTRGDVLADLRDVLALGRAHPQADPRAPAGAVGVSFGGHVAVLAAARLGLGAAVAAYAGWLTGADIAISSPEPTVTLAPEIARAGGRVLMLVGEADPMVPAADLDTIRDAFARAEAALELVTYPEVGHRFLAEGRPGYDAAAAADAWARIDAHLRAALRNPPAGG